MVKKGKSVNAAKKSKAKVSLDAQSLKAHHESLDELSKRVHSAMVELDLADPNDPPPGCHWEFIIGPNGVEKHLVC